MCIAIAKPKNIIIKESVLETCFDANPHGAGFSYIDRHKSVIEKGFFTFKDFKEAFEPHKQKQCLIHFRIKTHGEISKEMCHPFEITPRISMIHNGIISGHGKDTISDTACFVDTIIKPMIIKHGISILKTEAFKTLIEKYIGFSKLMFLDAKTNEFIIFNEQACNENSGIIFSNYSWQPTKKYIHPYYERDDEDTKYHSSWGVKKKETNLPVPIKKDTSFTAQVSSLTRYNGPTFIENDYVVIGEGNELKYQKGKPILNYPQVNYGDICTIEKLYANHRVDLYNYTQLTVSEQVPLWFCNKISEEQAWSDLG